MILRAVFLLLSASSVASEFEVYGRVSRLEDSQCRVCIGCEYVTGGLVQNFKCEGAGIVDQGKYRLRLMAKKFGGGCKIVLASPAALLPPEAPLPAYPDGAKLQRLLACE